MPYTAPPAKADLNNTPNTGVYKTAIGALWDMITNLIGGDGTPATAFDCLKVLDPQSIFNLSLVPTVGGNALTGTVKSRNGATSLAAANPGFVGQRSATPGSGLFNLRPITADIALTISNGSTLGHQSGVPAWTYWYLIDNAGAQELAVSSSYFGESGIVTTVAEGGAGAADSASVMYSAAVRTGVPFRCVFRTLDSQAAAGTWTAVPTIVQPAPFKSTEPKGQCRLTKSGANLLLSPINGNLLTVGGVDCIVPSAGVTLAATGLTPATLYYIYATQSNGVINALEASATGHSIDPVTGVEIKTGDSTRTLVGMARPITGPAWQDTSAQAFVRTWFNDPGIRGSSAFTLDRSTTSASYVELNSEIRNEFLCWANELVRFSAGGSQLNGTTNINQTGIAIDGTAPENPTYVFQGPFASCQATLAMNITKAGLAEGYHYATFVMLTGSGTTGVAKSGTTLITNIKG